MSKRIGQRKDVSGRNERFIFYQNTRLKLRLYSGLVRLGFTTIQKHVQYNYLRFVNGVWLVVNWQGSHGNVLSLSMAVAAAVDRVDLT